MLSICVNNLFIGQIFFLKKNLNCQIEKESVNICKILKGLSIQHSGTAPIIKDHSSMDLYSFNIACYEYPRDYCNFPNFPAKLSSTCVADSHIASFIK